MQHLSKFNQSVSKNLTLITFCATLLAPGLSSAAGITNGNFSTDDFSGWTLDTDGFSGTTADFQIVPATSDSQARIEADYWSTPGDDLSTPQDFVIFANTLYQNLDLSAGANQNLQLNFDWTFGGENTTFDENFLVGLGDGTGNYYGADGNLGFLLNPISYGSGTFTTLLDATFLNQPGWTLEFQMNSGFDAYGSFVNIDNVSLTAVSAVPLPGAIYLMVSGIFGLAGFSRRCKTAQFN